MQITMAGTCFFYDFDKQHCFAPDFQIYLLVYNMFCTWLTNLGLRISLSLSLYIYINNSCCT